MELYIDPNSIEWLGNGERGNAQNINRALFQYVTLANLIFGDIQLSLDGKKELEVLETDTIKQEHSGTLVVLNSDSSISGPIISGSVFNIACTGAVKVALPSGTFINNNSNEFEFSPGLSTIVKLNDLMWAVK